MKAILAATSRGSIRRRDLPAHVVVYYVIALALLLGYGVDSGIHIIQRTRTKAMTDDHMLKTSTIRVVVFSVLTTLAGFANLAFSDHLGLASMGQLLTVGLALTLCCEFIVLPALIKSGQTSPVRTRDNCSIMTEKPWNARIAQVFIRSLPARLLDLAYFCPSSPSPAPALWLLPWRHYPLLSHGDVKGKKS
ncbi:MAG: transposase domain-containing protein [Deltaproteobacteria bacterium]|nr:transposase domain-containing protein [Deltaproteobacteria bacterium]